MITLPEIKPILDRVIAATKIIDDDKSGCIVPEDLKNKLGAAWNKPFTVNSGSILLATSKKGQADPNQQEIKDKELIKCAIAVELYSAYALYKEQLQFALKRIALTTTELQLLGLPDELPKNMRDAINKEIDALVDLDSASKNWLKTFSTAPKKERKEKFGNYKQIMRTDAFWPAVADQIGLRTDLNSHLDPVITTLMENKGLTQSLCQLVPTQVTNEQLSKAVRRLCTFCKDYAASGVAWKRNDPKCTPAHESLQLIAQWFKDKFGSFKGIQFRESISGGATNFPKVPWASLLPPDQETSDGVYIAMCFGREGNGVVAGLGESSSNPRGLQTVKRKPPLKINVNGASNSTHYNDCFANPKDFEFDSFDADEFTKHVMTSIEECIKFLKLHPEASMFGKKQEDEFLSSLQKSGFTSSADIPNLFLKALAAKPFIILTGNSGTGKTKLAELFVQWLSGEAKGRHALVPVGADWTDNRNVLGFVNHLRLTKPEGGIDEIPIYQSTRILDLLLEASKNPSDPFFLILDEMNLSHVERYFADFLSALESNEAGLLLHREGRGLPRKLNGPVDVPEELALPSNLFVIGTVNVDETTYMFSPKVLDRANVLEFRLDDEATKKFLDAGSNRIKPITAAPSGYAQSFLELSHRARSSENPLPLVGDSATLPTETKKSLESCNKVMQELFGLMQKRHQEFAFRTIVEIRSFLAVDYELTIDKQGWDWKSAMDAQILQKILPKLHGSKRKIGVLLAALAKYCEHAIMEEAREFFAKETAADAYHAANEKRENAPQFPRSHHKLCEMIESVRRDQFVSFIQ